MTVASSHASCMISGGTTNSARVTWVFASHFGRGKLPMLVVARGASCMVVSVLSTLLLQGPLRLLPDQFLGGGNDLVDARQQILLQRRAERHRHRGEVESLGR